MRGGDAPPLARQTNLPASRSERGAASAMGSAPHSASRSGSHGTATFFTVVGMTSQSAPVLPASDAPCPCGSGRTFGQCCEPLLREQRPAADAAELMRSRFTAHAVRDHRHLHRTYLATARKPYVEEKSSGPEPTWTRLVVHTHEPGPKPDMAFVEFSAYYKDGDEERALEEKSEFQRIDGNWFYTRSIRVGPPPVKAAPKVGRNDPCPCGSGKKYKHCCGK
jgi:SEC-C motif domain protein